MPTQGGKAYSSAGLSQGVIPEPISTKEASPCSNTEESTDPTISIPPGFKLTFHSKVYTLAEKCWLDDLKELQDENLRQALEMTGS